MPEKNEFEELFSAMAASRKLCPWAKKKTMEEAAGFVVAEAKELFAEVKTNSVEEMKDELGDVLALAMFFSVIAEEKGYFSIRDSLKNAVEKFRRRKPWIFDEKIKVESAEKALELYYKAKKKEKLEKAAKKAKP